MKIAQDEHYHGGDWWTWSVWLDGIPGELDQVQKVVWRLHPTFLEPVREQTNRHESFKLTTAGWGSFKVRAEVAMRDGTVVKLHHHLELTYPGGRRTMA